MNLENCQNRKHTQQKTTYASPNHVPTPNHDSTGCKMRGFFIARLKLN